MHDPNETMTRVIKLGSAEVISPIEPRCGVDCPLSSPARRVSRTRRPGSNWAGARHAHHGGAASGAAAAVDASASMTCRLGPSLQMWPHTYLGAIGTIADMLGALTQVIE